MADSTITGLTSISSVDRATDVLPIVDVSDNQTKKGTVDAILGITGNPVGHTDTQTLTNKTLTSPTITVLDNALTIQDNADATKQLQFQLSSITTGTTRTLTVPDASDTLVTLAATQTLTNKTLTSPTINTATIANPTLTVDTISEFTGANGVTIDGVKLKDGALATNNSVVTANITDGAVTPAKLVSGTGSSWTWASWAPTWTNVTVGAGTVTAKYIQDGKTVHFRLNFILSGSTISGLIGFSLPVTAATHASTVALSQIGTGRILDTGTTVYMAAVALGTTTRADIQAISRPTTYLERVNTSGTVPIAAWADNDEIYVEGKYEAA